MNAPVAEPTVATGGPAHRAFELAATAEEIDTWSMPDRLDFLGALTAGPAGELGASDRWRNHRGVIAFFHAHDLGAPGTWISWVNAEVLLSIQDGIKAALAARRDDNLVAHGDLVSLGAVAWADYLIRLSRDELRSQAGHAVAWSHAKERATTSAVERAAARGLRPTDAEERFLRAAETYNWLMRNPVLVQRALPWLRLLVPGIVDVEGVIERLFDQGDEDLARRGCGLAWEVANIEPGQHSLLKLVALLPKVSSILESHPISNSGPVA